MPRFSRATRTARNADGLTVALRPLDPASPWIGAWRKLGRQALVDNLFFEPDFLLSAAGTIERGIGLLLVCDRPPEEADARVLALWPCRMTRRWGVPIAALMGSTHGFSIFGAPLVDRGDPKRALSALFDAPRLLALPRRMMLPYLPLDGPLAALFASVVAERGGRRADFWMHARGALDLSGLSASDRAGYLAASLSVSKARQLNRLYRRLEASGPVIFQSVRDPDRLDAALDDFLALEAAGWKGRAGTSAANRPNEVSFLHRLVRAYGARGEARIDRLHRNDRTLAVSMAFETGGTLWYLKIAHDEDEARNSPGAQLSLRVTRAILDDTRIATADSCAPPDFPMITNFWAERRRLGHALIDTGGDRLFPLAVGLERLRAKVAAWRAGRARD